MARLGAPSGGSSLAQCELASRVGAVRGKDARHAKAWAKLSERQKGLRGQIDALDASAKKLLGATGVTYGADYVISARLPSSAGE